MDYLESITKIWSSNDLALGSFYNQGWSGNRAGNVKVVFALDCRDCPPPSALPFGKQKLQLEYKLAIIFNFIPGRFFWLDKWSPLVPNCLLFSILLNLCGRFCIRQTLRSGIHFSAKVRQNRNWSNGVRKGEFDLFWCIFITKNVKSYKKFNERARTAIFSVHWLTGALC